MLKLGLHIFTVCNIQWDGNTPAEMGTVRQICVRISHMNHNVHICEIIAIMSIYQMSTITLGQSLKDYSVKIIYIR